jgi:membrane-associated phospholipid phosphatase
MDSLIVYGLLAHWLAQRLPDRRRAIIAAAVVLVALIGFARIYLGVHFVSDVVAGYCAGAVWLFACITGERFAARREIGSTGT